MATCPLIKLPDLLVACVLFVSFLLFIVVFSGEPKQNYGRESTRGRVGRPQTSSSSQVILLLAVSRRLFCFGSLVLDVVFRYLSLFLLYINIKIG